MKELSVQLDYEQEVVHFRAGDDWISIPFETWTMINDALRERARLDSEEKDA